MEETLEKILSTHRRNELNATSILRDIQEAFGYIPEEAVEWFSKRLNIPASRFFGIATFYRQFYLKPRGKNVITVCRGTSCHVKGSEKLLSSLRKKFNLPDGEDTTTGREYTIESGACVGACGMAPVVIINKKVCSKVTLNRLLKELKTLESKK